MGCGKSSQKKASAPQAPAGEGEKTILVGTPKIQVQASKFRHLRFTPLKLRSSDANSVQIAEIEFKASGSVVSMRDVTATNPGGNNPSGESPDKAVDGSTSTKWLDFNKGSLVLTWGTNVDLHQFRFVTANDETSRDPIQWRVEGGITLDGEWTLLHSQTTDYATPTERLTATDWFQLEANAQAQSPAETDYDKVASGLTKAAAALTASAGIAAGLTMAAEGAAARSSAANGVVVPPLKAVQPDPTVLQMPMTEEGVNVLAEEQPDDASNTKLCNIFTMCL